MFTEKELLTRLQNGEDVEKIADELIDTLNAANKTYTDQKEAEEKAKLRNVQKEKDMDHVLDVIFNFITDYYPDYAESVESFRDEVNAAEVIEIIDELFEYISALKALGDKLSALEGVKGNPAATDLDSLFEDLLNYHAPKTPTKKPMEVKRSSDAVIKDFLNKNKW